jgi:urea transporter
MRGIRGGVRSQLVPVAEAVGATLIVLGLALVAVWAALVTAGGFILAAAWANDAPVRAARR